MHDLLIKGGTIVDGSGRSPVVGDVAVTDGKIVEVGTVSESARRIVDADGAVVAPGWIDVHTHYDGQVTWDDQLEGSTANGVSTLVFGNCGVGFAPVRSDGVDTLIDLMEGVEDIPGTALYEGVPWGEWETFSDYLQFLGRRRYACDITAQVPHGALRYYVMGDRAVHNEDATDDDLVAMSRLAEEAMRAGAVGFSTSRIQGHRSVKGGEPVPGTFAPEAELSAIAEGMVRGGGGVFQAIPSGATGEVVGVKHDVQTLHDEIAMFGRVSRRTGLLFTYTTAQTNSSPTMWRDALAWSAAENQAGASLRPQIGPRGVGTITSLDAYHIFMGRPSYERIAGLPLPERVREMRRPEVRAAILSESQIKDGQRPGAKFNVLPGIFESALASTYVLRDPIDYEPPQSESIAAQAAAAGRSAMDLMYDVLLEDDGLSVCYIPNLNYADGNLDACYDMLRDPNTVMGLSDAGAHVNYVCDMSNSTFLLTHWARDRARGPRLPLEDAVARGTGDCARAWGLTDRGRLEVGLRADINVIDFDNLKILRPEVRHDLPAGGRRFLQLADGYVATIVAGEVIRSNGKDTGCRPGRLLKRPTAGQ
jgi:N-acyl-D-amino-acid deacylase